MATLFERLIGLNTNVAQLPENTKLSIHSLAGSLDEQGAGYVDGPYIVAQWDLNVPQTADFQYMVTLALDAPNRTAYMRVYKDILYLGEAYTDSYPDDRYINEVWFWNRLESCVTDQGGTVTPRP